MRRHLTPFLFLAFVFGLHAAEAKKPNIVFIFTDDLGYGDIGCFGAQDIQTPRIDSLAADGMRFTEFYAASSVCSPSRFGFLTGRYPVRAGINGVFFPESFSGIDPGETTIAELLRENGYVTSLVGKWHLGHHFKHLPLQNGFDEYFGIPYSNDMDMAVYMRGNDVESYEVDQRYMTRRYAQEAVSFIERNAENPFFLFLSHNMPHVPLYVSEEFKGSSQRGLYGDVVQEIDWSVGEVLDTLDRLGLAENTLVIFSSDNGPWTVMEDHGGSSGGLREGKMFTFDGGMKVPTIARWPVRIAGGSISTELATMLDWFPTFASMGGAELPGDREIDGLDLSGVLDGIGKRASDEFFFFHMSGELRCYRQGNWKLKIPFEGVPWARWRQAVAAHPLSLFDLEKDPAETQNLAELYPEKAAFMQERMRGFLESLGELPPSKIVRLPADESHYDHLGPRRKESD